MYTKSVYAEPTTNTDNVENVVTDTQAPESIAINPAPTPEPIPLDTVVVRVNGEDVTQGNLLDASKFAVSRFMMQMGGGQKMSDQELDAWAASMIPQIRGKVVTGLLMEQALKKKIAEDNISIPAEEMNAEIEKARKFVADSKRAPSLEDALASENMTLDDLKTKINERYSFEKALMDILKKNYGYTPKPDEELQKLYNDHIADRYTLLSASHILIASQDSDSDTSKSAAKAKAEDLLKQVKDGGDFEALAKKYSDCPSSEEGGNLGFFPQNAMVPEFTKALEATNEDTLYPEIVKTQFGYHIIKRGPNKVYAFDEVKDSIEGEVNQESLAQAQAKMSEDLQKNAKIEDLVGKTEFAPDTNADVDMMQAE